MDRRLIAAFVPLFWLVAVGTCAFAGGGPENVLLLVNAASEDSRTVANHYVKLRGIPASNVVVLSDITSDESIGVEDFRTKILVPALREMAARGIGGQIDYIVYSVDFPTQVDLTGDGRPAGLPATGKLDPFAPKGSLNSMTYLWQLVMTKDSRYVGNNTNRYWRHPQNRPALATQGFGAWRGWDDNGAALAEGGMHYYLSTMLGVTGRRGNTPAEIVAYLDAAAKADGTQPKGTIYYVQSEDKARSGPRHGLYDAAVKELGRLDVRGEVLRGQMPMGKADVQGVMMGVGKFDWSTSGSRIMPGAICDHLTSFGGVFSGGGSQTPLTAYLKYGAAGACGAVVEPLNIAAKFPHPSIHAHYAEGCSLAEAFYQSIGWVYQIAIVGDPLCQPWANIPKVNLDGVKANARVKRTVTITPKATVSGGRGIARFELFVDGARRDKVKVGESFSLDTTELADGYHELRVVAIEGGPIESQGRAIVPFWVNNDAKVLTMTSAAKRVRLGEKIEIKLNGSGAKRIVVTHQGSEIGSVKGSGGRVTIDTKKLGTGTVVLEATSFVAIGKDGNEEKPLATAAPLVVEVMPK